MLKLTTPHAKEMKVNVTTTDPMTGNDVYDLDNAPFVVEGKGENALKIYFESEQSKKEYLEFAAESADNSSVDAYNQIANNETMRTIN
jgi:hypothetical protein